jgi:hypothetical protein
MCTGPPNDGEGEGDEAQRGKSLEPLKDVCVISGIVSVWKDDASLKDGALL